MQTFMSDDNAAAILEALAGYSCGRCGAALLAEKNYACACGTWHCPLCKKRIGYHDSCSHAIAWRRSNEFCQTPGMQFRYLPAPVYRVSKEEGIQGWSEEQKKEAFGDVYDYLPDLFGSDLKTNCIVDVQRPLVLTRILPEMTQVIFRDKYGHRYHYWFHPEADTLRQQANAFLQKVQQGRLRLQSMKPETA